MFTLKLYRRHNPKTVKTRIVPCHHIETISFQYGDDKGIEVLAFDGPEPSTYTSYVIGDEDAHIKNQKPGDAPLRSSDDWFGWGLLENEAGRTTEHFRPASYG